MPKPRYSLDIDTIPVLLSALQQKTKIKLQSHSDSIKISDVINATGLQISPHTLSRLAGFFASTTKPYLHNINTIAYYLGFRDVFDFEKNAANKEYQNWQYNVIESEAMLAFERLKPRDFLDSFVQLVPMSNPHIRLLHVLAREFRSGTKRGLKLLKEIEKHEKASYLYHQFFIDEDNNQGYFVDSLERIINHRDLTVLEKVFYVEFASNKYFEREEWGKISERNWKSNFKANVKSEHVENPHLMSRLFVNYLYYFTTQGVLNSKQYSRLLDKGIDYILEVDYFPARLAWLGRLVKCYLYIRAEDVLKANVRLKDELLNAIKSDVEDYEFQPVLQYAALLFQWISENDIRSYRSNWLNAVVYSSAWDFMTMAYASRYDSRKYKAFSNKAQLVAVQVNSKLMLRMIERHQNELFV
ncbi:MAG: hypothetical protein RLY35_175 [Bacteroidota bacterium]|jgi:hypothetical protein